SILNSIKTTRQSIPRIIFRSDPAPSEAFVNIQKRLSGRFFCHMRLYGLQPLRNSFQSIILIRLHSVFFFGSAAASPTAFSLCGNTNMPQTGLLTYSPQRLYHELLFLSHAAL